jgi:Nicotinic acid mononucleotide adenylyltransferase
MLRLCTADEPRFSIGISEGGLFVEIAGEARALYPGAELWFLCGRDAAERIVNWDYGDPDAVAGMLEQFSLLVAQRVGHYEAPESIRHRVKALAMEGFDEVSSTQVREGAADLAPEEIRDEVRRIYFDGRR